MKLEWRCKQNSEKKTIPKLFEKFLKQNIQKKNHFFLCQTTMDSLSYFNKGIAKDIKTLNLAMRILLEWMDTMPVVGTTAAVEQTAIVVQGISCELLLWVLIKLHCNDELMYKEAIS